MACRVSAFRLKLAWLHIGVHRSLYCASSFPALGPVAMIFFLPGLIRSADSARLCARQICIAEVCLQRLQPSGT